MTTYFYAAKDANGRVVESSLEADSRYHALSLLRHQGLMATQLGETSVTKEGGVRALAKRVAVLGEKLSKPACKKVTLSEKAVFCQQLAISVGAGVPLRESLESIAMDMDNEGFAEVVRRVTAEIREGKTFSQALRTHKSVFDPLFVALIRAAEEAGSMERTLQYLAESTESQDALARKVRSILAYPLFVCIFFLLICGVMTFFVIPKFQDIFVDFGAELPMITKIVFGFNRGLITNIHFILLGLGGAIAGFTTFKRTARGRLWIDTVKLKLPVIGEIVRKLAMARFCRNLAIMMHGGVPVATALDISCDVCGNAVMKRSLLTVRENVIQGSDISTSLAREKVFPRVVTRMVRVGEASGELPQVLDKVSTVYEGQVETAMVMAMSLIEPLVICLFGVIITSLVLAIYVPVFSVSTSVK